MTIGSALSRVIWTIIWLLILVIVSLIVAGISAFVYILVSILTPCISQLESLKDLALQGLNFPNTCSRNMVKGQAYSGV